MSDHDGSLAQLVGLIGEEMGDVLGSSGIQGRGRLIGQNNVWVMVERHGDGCALALTPRELGGVGVCSLRDAERVQEMIPPVGIAL